MNDNKSNKSTTAQTDSTKHHIKISKYAKWLLLIIFSIIVGFFAYKKWQPSVDMPNYITTQVVKGDIKNTVMASGKVKAINSVNVGAQVSGEITRLYVKVGDVVKKGDLIAQINEVTQKNQLTNTEATLTQSQAGLETATATLVSREASLHSAQEDLTTTKASLVVKKSELDRAERYLRRMTPLLEISAISKIEYDDAKHTVLIAKNGVISAESNLQSTLAVIESKKADINSAKANISSQQANVQKSETDVNTANERLGNTTIVAPIDGTVVSISAEQGTTVNANQSVPTIVTLAELSRIRINAQISEADVDKVTVGMPVLFNMIGSPDDKKSAILTGIEPAPEMMNSSSHTSAAVYYVGYVEADNPDGKFRIDMTAQLEIIIQQEEEVLIIPSTAIRKGENDKKNQSFVEVLNNDRNDKVNNDSGTEHESLHTHKVPIKIGIDNRVNVQVVSGLNEGDKVVINNGDSDKKAENGKKKGKPRAK